MALKITTTAENAWLIKRFAISSSFYFGCSTAQRRFIQQRIAIAKGISTSDELCAHLKIQPRAWASFVNEFFKQGGVIRDYNGKAGYHQVHTDRPDAAAFASQPLPGEAAYKKQLEELAKKFADGKAPAISETAASEFKNEELEGDDDADSNKSPDSPIGALQERLRNELAKAQEKATKLEAEVKAMETALKNSDSEKVVRIELKKADAPDFMDTGVQHRSTPDLLVRVQCGLNVYLVGPAGSGKTTAGEKVAEALGLKFGFMSVGPQTTKSDVFGYMDAKGEYIPTEFRRRYENGGVFLFDEMDAGHAGVLTQINAALAGSSCAFPDRMVKKHADFRCLGAGNTFGTGPDRVYVGRNELDKASLDRFSFLEWAYDEALELYIAKSLTKNEEVARTWTAYVQAVRKAVAKLGLRHVVSPRATINGVKLLSAGVDRKSVETTDLFKSLKPDEIARIEATMKAA